MASTKRRKTNKKTQSRVKKNTATQELYRFILSYNMVISIVTFFVVFTILCVRYIGSVSYPLSSSDYPKPGSVRIVDRKGVLLYETFLCFPKKKEEFLFLRLAKKYLQNKQKQKTYPILVIATAIKIRMNYSTFQLIAMELELENRCRNVEASTQYMRAPQVSLLVLKEVSRRYPTGLINRQIVVRTSIDLKLYNEVQEYVLEQGGKKMAVIEQNQNKLLAFSGLPDISPEAVILTFPDGYVFPCNDCMTFSSDTVVLHAKGADDQLKKMMEKGGESL